jgi:hypothetical protein
MKIIGASVSYEAILPFSMIAPIICCLTQVGHSYACLDNCISSNVVTYHHNLMCFAVCW